MLHLYSIFHLNLAYSSIPESKRKEVIDRCFWPLLDLASVGGFPVAVTAPAYTLEVASRLDSKWMGTLSDLVRSHHIEFIGAGYSQLIGPLVPDAVNKKNLQIGADIYLELFGAIPHVWYVNEQAYSKSLLEHYLGIGAKAIVMEWNNPRTYHSDWKEEYRYSCQRALGMDDESIPLIWNDSITFQKFQRMAHGEIKEEELREYLLKHCSDDERYMCLYGNDAEIFDFRPGRFKTEPRLEEKGEWKRISDFYRTLRNDSRFGLVFPSQSLESVGNLDSNVGLSLESSAQPIPVKKQPKYNVTRWSVTGRDDIFANTACHQMERKLVSLISGGILNDLQSRVLWKELCYLWSSDFRTHITQDRWEDFIHRIAKMRNQVEMLTPSAKPDIYSSMEQITVNGLGGVLDLSEKPHVENEFWDGGESFSGCSIDRDDRFLTIKSASVQITFNCRRGLAIDRIVFPECSDRSIVGSIPHGYFSNIALSADWYTANSVLQRPGHHQLTDLENTTVSVSAGFHDKQEWICCSATISTELGDIRKRILIHKRLPQIDFEFIFDWPLIPPGSFKTAFVTLIPDSFAVQSLFYATHNGGGNYEVFPLLGTSVLHDTPSSSIVSASHGLGATKGLVAIGDCMKGVALYIDKSTCAAMPMITYLETPPSFFARIVVSCAEMDESRMHPTAGPLRMKWSLTGLKRLASN